MAREGDFVGLGVVRVLGTNAGPWCHWPLHHALTDASSPLCARVLGGCENSGSPYPTPARQEGEPGAAARADGLVCYMEIAVFSCCVSKTNPN